MRAPNKMITAILGGSVDAVKYGLIMAYDKTTGLAVLAHDEEQDLFILLSSTEKVGDAITLLNIKTLNESHLATITSSCSRGDKLYLDEQVNAAAATGKLKKTPGNAKKVLFLADDACLVADGRIPVLAANNFALLESTEGLLATIGGTQTILKGDIVTYAIATGVCNRAFDEDVLMFVAQNGGAVGEKIRIKPITTLNEEWTGLITEAAAVGDSLYLDEQANEAAATGKLKKTAGSTTLAIATANSVASGAGAINFYSINNLAGHV
ncbi:MAG: hypothetical protein ACTSXT_13795 [Candidatus Helarchaeota archaeon]